MKYFYTAVLVAFLTSETKAFTSPTTGTTSKYTQKTALEAHNKNNSDDQKRRAFLSSIIATTSALTFSSENAWAGIDVSGLSVEGGKSSNVDIVNQLRTQGYDGSASTRVQEIKSTQSAQPTAQRQATTTKQSEEEDLPYATFAYQSSFLPKLSRNVLKLTDTFEGQLIAPSSYRSKGIYVSFEFPSDWLQLDRMNGGIQYVDQRNGDRLYVLRSTLPADKTLADVPKSFFGESIFDTRGSIQKNGNLVDEYRVSTSQILQDSEGTATRRRLKMKYYTVTGNGLRTERRALVDAYEIPGTSQIFMLMTSSNAVKFEQKDSRERKTVENIVDSFVVEV